MLKYGQEGKPKIFGMAKIKGHERMDLERFYHATEHMIEFHVLSYQSPVGTKGDHMRLYLSDGGYKDALAAQERGEIRTIKHAKIIEGKLYYD